MSNVAITVDPRMRALSFLVATGVIALLCSLMLVVSQVARYSDDSDNSVRIFMEEAPRDTPPPPTRASPPPRNGFAVRSPDAAPTPTPLPVDTTMLARAMACFDRLNRNRPESCPREALEEEPGDRARTRRSYDISPERAPPIEYPMGIDPPCDRGIHLTGAGIAGCVGFGVTPPPPSRSAEEVCVAGGVGPCHPPPFRPEDVERLGHTQ